MTVLRSFVVQEVKKDTEQIKTDTAAIKDDTELILAEIARLRSRLPEEKDTHEGKRVVLERFLDNMTDYAETVADGSDVDLNEVAESETLVEEPEETSSGGQQPKDVNNHGTPVRENLEKIAATPYHHAPLPEINYPNDSKGPQSNQNFGVQWRKRVSQESRPLSGAHSDGETREEHARRLSGAHSDGETRDERVRRPTLDRHDQKQKSLDGATPEHAVPMALRIGHGHAPGHLIPNSRQEGQRRSWHAEVPAVSSSRPNPQVYELSPQYRNDFENDFEKQQSVPSGVSDAREKSSVREPVKHKRDIEYDYKGDFEKQQSIPSRRPDPRARNGVREPIKSRQAAPAHAMENSADTPNSIQKGKRDEQLIRNASFMRAQSSPREQMRSDLSLRFINEETTIRELDGLLRSGADPNRQIPDIYLLRRDSFPELPYSPFLHRWPIIQAALSNNLKCLNLLIQYGANPNVQQQWDEYLALKRNDPTDAITALQAAAAFGFEEIADVLLRAGANVNITGGYFGTALQAAASLDTSLIPREVQVSGAAKPKHNWLGPKLHIFRQLIFEGNADVNRAGGYYHTPLQAACSHTISVDFRFIGHLLETRGAHVNIVGGIHGSALHAAIINGEALVVQNLLDRGADPDLWAMCQYPISMFGLKREKCVDTTPRQLARVVASRPDRRQIITLLDKADALPEKNKSQNSLSDRLL